MIFFFLNLCPSVLNRSVVSHMKWSDKLTHRAGVQSQRLADSATVSIRALFIVLWWLVYEFVDILCCSVDRADNRVSIVHYTDQSFLRTSGQANNLLVLHSIVLHNPINLIKNRSTAKHPLIRFAI